MNQDTVLTRIAKLLAMKEARGATEAEAAIATEHVQRLLREHNLTLSQVEQHSGSDGTPSKRVKDGSISASPFQQWRVILLDGIADSNFCLAKPQIYYDDRDRRRQRVVLVGREVNVRACQLTYDYLTKSLVRELKDQGYSLTDSTGYSKEGSYFLTGAANRISDRLAERRKQAEAESAAKEAERSQGNGTHRELVLSDVYGSEADLNNDALNGYPLGTTAQRNREYQERQARQQAEHDRLVAEGVDETVAWYRAYGYSEERALSAAASWKRSQSRSRGGRGHSSQNWSRRDEAHYVMRNSAAYSDGAAVGEKIGLEEQVSASQRKRIGR